MIAFGQYTVDFSRVYGGSKIDEGFSVDVDNITEFVIAGGRSFSDDFYLHENNAGSDYWMMQMTPDGDTIWSRSYGGSNNDDLRVVRYDENGGITAFGTTWSDGTGDVPSHPGQVGAWLLSTDQAGNVGVSVVYSGTLGEQGIDFHPLPDGGHALLVQATSPILEGDMNHGNFDFWVARVNAIGIIEWSGFYGGFEADVPSRILRTVGGYFLIGSTASVNGDITENAGGYDYWVIKIDLNGNLEWQKTFGGSGDDLARDGVILEDGSILIAGESDSEDGDRTMSFGGSDIWLIRIDADGNLIWEKSYGGTEDDAGQRIARAGDTRLVLVAQTKSDDGNMTGNKGRQDVWISYLNMAGTVVQQMNYGGTLDDYGRGLVVSEDSLVYMIGSSLSANGNVPPGYAFEDLWLMRMGVPNEPCATNNACFPFDQVNFAVLRPESNGPVVCVNGCNAGADKGPSGPAGCTNFQGAAAWFKVKTDDVAEVLTIRVTTPEFNIPQILVMNGVNCFNFSPVNCDYGSDGVVSLINLPVDPDTSYYVIVGDGTGMEGKFDLCVSTLDIEFCNRDPRLYVTQTSLGSPLSGPFLPGEEVQICYEVTVWDKLDCNGLQGILPEFGEGWDSTSFNSMGRPVQIDTMLEAVIANGEWDWWPLGTVHYNFTNPVFGYSGGQTLPTGWYFVNHNDPLPNDDPDESIGDIENCVNDESRWKVCFTLTTKSECVQNLDCSVEIKTFADGEIGAIVSQACQNDPPMKLNRFLNCCIPAFIEAIPDFTICSGDTIIITPQSSLNPPVVYTWGINVSGNIVGATSGTTTNVIVQHLVNLSNSIGSVTYTLRGSASMCETPFEEFTINVLPQPSANMSLVGSSLVCRGDSTEVRFDFIGDGPFIAEYEINGTMQPPILSETQSIIVSVPVNEAGLVTFVRYQDRNCIGNPNGTFFVNVLEPGELALNMSICEGDTVEIDDRVITFPGNYTFILENASANGCDSIVMLDLQVFEEYERNLDLRICEGQAVLIGTQEFTETGFYPIELTTAHGCDSIINLTLSVLNEIVVVRNSVICAGTSVEFGGETLFQDGTYYDTIPITPTCDSIYILNLNVLDVIVLIQTVIEPDTGQSSGSIMIQVAGGIPPYSYLWSNGDTTNHPMNLDPGSYELIVTDVLGCTAEYNFFLVSSSEDLLPGFNEVTVFPNPISNSDVLNVSISRDAGPPQSMIMRLRDARGRIINEQFFELVLAEEKLILRPSNLSGGLYLLQISDQVTGASLVRRIIIQ
jgi:hypothetical protein